MKYILLFWFTVSVVVSADAQLFELEHDAFTGLYWGKIRFVDIDNDNDLDLINNGFSEGIDGFELKVYENVNGEFFERATALPDVRNGEFALGDFDNDNDLDILLTGFLDGLVERTELYENKGGLTFTLKASLQGMFNSSAGFFDLDNDGDLDIALSGIYNTYDGEGNQFEIVKTFIYENNGGVFSEVHNTNLAGCFQCSMDFADRNGDGLTDLAILGFDGQSEGKSMVYLNNGNKTFTPDPTANFAGAYNGDIAWGDFDNDGDKDILLTGFNTFPVQVTKVYENTGAGWKDRTDIHLEAAGDTYFGGTRWIDYDADGFLDIVLTGRGDPPTELYFNFKIYLNDQHGNFSLVDNTNFVDLASSSLDYGDFDNDGDTDFAFMGIAMINGDVENRKMMTGVYKNLANQKAFAPNIIPVAPTVSTFTETSFFRNDVVLNWNSGTDAETPSTQLQYNVRVRSASKNILLPASDLSNGYIRSDKPYNASTTRLWMNNIPEGNVFWSVQTVDAAKRGSPFSGEKQFYQINGPEAAKAEIVDVTHVRLTWKDNSSIETNYKIERSLTETKDFATIQTLPANTTTFTNGFAFLTDTYYYYRITAYNSTKASAYDSLKVVIPTAPASLAGTAPNASRIDLTWDDLSAYEKGYILERRLSTETLFVAIANLPAGTQSFQDSNLAGATTYVYRVVATNEYGKSAYSNEASIKTNTKPFSENFELEVDEDHTLAISAADFEQHYSDDEGDALFQVRFVQLPANGNLKLDNVDIVVGQAVATSSLSQLTFVPNANAFGDMGMVYRVHDGKDYANQTSTLKIKVLPVNDPPTISAIEDVEIENGITIPAIVLQVADVDTELSSLEVTGESGNVALITNEGVSIIKTVDGFTLTLLPLEAAAGESTITVTVGDGELTATTSFTLTVHEIVMGIEDESSVALEYFPVPVTDMLHLRNPDAKSRDVTLTDISGRPVITKVISFGETTLDLTTYPSGVYLLHVNSGVKSRAYKVIKR